MGSLNRMNCLKSIPETNEIEEPSTKWVPKKKHEVLKAKYKFLKKLFQIYDANLYANPGAFALENVEAQAKHRRNKRRHRSKAAAFVGTSSEKSLLQDKESTCKSQIVLILESEKTGDKEAVECSSRECNTQTAPPHPMNIPNVLLNEKRKLTSFQSFIYRMFGISLNGTNLYAFSDNNYRRRRSFRIGRASRVKRIQSECGLKTTTILSFVQNVQRNCLMDGTPRQCPIVGCKCMLYGIINYNDHLNLCHFLERKHICHYCHEGFGNEYDLLVHENEHLGLTKLRLNRSTDNCQPHCCSTPTCNTRVQDIQTDKFKIDAKLKKIVSFFDSIDPEVLNKLKKNRSSESKSGSTNQSLNSVKCSVSCTNDSIDPEVLNKLKKNRSSESKSGSTNQSLNSVKCSVSCTKTLQTRFEKTNFTSNSSEAFFGSGKSSLTRERAHRREGGKSLPKFHNSHRGHRSSSSANEKTDVGSPRSSVTQKNSIHMSKSLICDPSTNIVYYSSKETLKKESTMSMLSQKLIKSIKSYKWEPHTKVIRV